MEKFILFLYLLFIAVLFLKDPYEKLHESLNTYVRETPSLQSEITFLLVQLYFFIVLLCVVLFSYGALFTLNEY